ncbi:hypothetical protein PLEOSDRAFT_1039502 [Pleurotus ostreatus PC15]|uniref:Calcineurin-like phosphoesterase domain-containing protein n=1 Tax=Pleurotus ostreatus (strain PC15) TaxID=1137138 RepID=A0A067NM76_PLEO1|nr:hypothetical protein PLEOSDRAFT_1039502 [Pleurotus ostreatus PC15]
MFSTTRHSHGLDSILERQVDDSTLRQRWIQSPSFPFFLLSTIYHYFRHIPLLPAPPLDPTKIRLVCISDTHNNILPLPDVPLGDVLIHAGDLSQSGSAEELQKTLDWLRSLPHRHKVFIGGNHDTGLANGTHSALDMSDLIYLCDEGISIRVRGRMLRVYGSPWTPQHGNFVFQYPRHAAHARWAELVDESEAGCKLDVLVTHGPPKGHVDHLGYGCEGLLDGIWRVKPKVMICGHIHAGRGMELLKWDEGQRMWENVVRAGNRVGWLSMVATVWTLVYAWLTQRGRDGSDACYIVNCAVVGGARDDLLRPAVVLDV